MAKLGKGRVKRCGYHKVEHPLNNDVFPHDKREKDGYSVWCKEAWKEYQAKRKALKATATGKPAGKKQTKAQKTEAAVKQFKGSKAGTKKAEKKSAPAKKSAKEEN